MPKIETQNNREAPPQSHSQMGEGTPAPADRQFVVVTR
jgi:hypothetical protein